MNTILRIRGGIPFILLLTLIIGVALTSSISRATAEEDFESVDIGQTIEVGDLTVTVERLLLGRSETRLELAFESESAIGVSPVGPPTIHLPNGDVLKTKGLANGINAGTGEGLFDRTYILEGIPGGVNAVTIDLASHIAYYESAYSIHLPIDELLGEFDHASVNEPETYTLGYGFSVGPAQFELTSLVLRPAEFSFSFRPLNKEAQKTVVSGTLSHVSARDGNGTIFPSGLAIANWSDAQDSVRSQSLFFEGTINPEAIELILEVDGIGEIKTPGSIRVSLP